MDNSKAENVQLSQGLEVLKPRSGKAYPVPCDEWNFLKKKLQSASGAPWILPAIGFLLLGTALTTLINLQIGGTRDADHRIAWAVILNTGFTGVACLGLSIKQRRMNRTQVSDVVQQMNLIERRFDDSESPQAVTSALSPSAQNLPDIARQAFQSIRNGAP